jgi:hypothetical protein
MATAGLKAAPDTWPTANAPARTVKPIARPKWEFPAVASPVATFNTTYTSANVKRNSARNTPNTGHGMESPVRPEGRSR